ncbi:MAG: ABC transporter ATP-binding protein [Clostridia bacterium]|nr:ABC transporter ATP-binding protein [Clostridia bacterium]
MESIKTLKLTKKYKDTIAVDRLDLTVKRGELFALLGINGAGKTTTIKMLCGLTRPTDGDALILGKSVLSEMVEIKRLIGVSPQETAVALGLTVKENLELICGINKMPLEKATELCNTFGLNGVFGKKAGKLSGGFQRRLSIAMSLINEPEILFLDEPTLGLDVIARSELWDTIRSLKGKVTVILTTHYMEEAEALSDRIGIMKSGRLLTIGTADELKQKAEAEKFEDAFVKIVKGDIS